MAENTLISFENLSAVLLEYGNEVRNQYQLNLVMSDRIASGELLNSCEFDLQVNGSTFNVRLEMAEYWKYIETGTSPYGQGHGTANTSSDNRPLKDKILDWILIKPVVPRPDKKPLPTPQQLAYLIARKIYAKGIEGTHDLERARDSLIKKYEPKIIAALAKDVSSYLTRIMIDGRIQMQGGYSL